MTQPIKHRSTAPCSVMAAVLSALFLLSLGCASSNTAVEAPNSSAAGTGLNPAKDRVTDERILSDSRTLYGVQIRLQKLSEAGVPQNNYSLAKAQCWLDTAQSQFYENDRTGYIEESLTEAVNIVSALEANKAARVGFDTPLVARSSKIRDDLWAQLNAYKNQASTLVCTSRTVACAEVRLVRAGHANQQTGWRQATPHVQMVEDALRVAKIQADACVQPKAVK